MAILHGTPAARKPRLYTGTHGASMRNVVFVWVSLALLVISRGFAAEPANPRLATGVAPPKRIPSPVAAPAADASEPVTIASVPVGVRRAVVADAARRFQVEPSAVVLT